MPSTVTAPRASANAATRATPARVKPPAATPADRTDALIAGPAPAILAAPRNFPLHRLRRADENVRHTRSDAAVEELAASIRAHGLCQNLIGYEAKIGGYPDPRIMVVGGGRRLMALARLEQDGVIDENAEVPVLIRDRDMAVELSLAENLEHENMSPVDEFKAFRLLIETGRFDAHALAARFGWKVRQVQQRLRLAELHPEILDALADRQLTLEAAMAYAGAQSQDLQVKVFRMHQQDSWRRHDTTRIKDDLRRAGADTSHRLFKFVGAKDYEAAGGGYEDDLFDAAEIGGERRLTAPDLLEGLAHAKLDRSEAAIVRELRVRDDLTDTLTGIVRMRGLLQIYTAQPQDFDAPDGWLGVPRQSFQADAAWRTVRHNGLPAMVGVAIDAEGKIQPQRTVIWVEQGRERDIDPQPGPARTGASTLADPLAAARSHLGAAPSAAPAPAPAPAPSTPVISWADRERALGIERWKLRLALPRFTGTPFEGIAFWGSDHAQPVTLHGEAGMAVHVDLWVSNAAIAAQDDAAALAAFEAEKARFDAYPDAADEVAK